MRSIRVTSETEFQRVSAEPTFGTNHLFGDGYFHVDEYELVNQLFYSNFGVPKIINLSLRDFLRELFSLKHIVDNSLGNKNSRFTVRRCLL